MDDQTPQPQPSTEQTPPKKRKKPVKQVAIVSTTLLVLAIGSFAAFQFAKGQNSTIVLPGGVTYLGPSNTPIPTKAPQVQGVTTPGKIIIAPTTPWGDMKGKLYPFTFSYPTSLNMVVFTNDVTDAHAISWPGVPPQENILVRVADLNTSEKAMSAYINRPKREYVDNWWKQYSGLKGVASVLEFVNTKGSKGYRAKYINSAGQTPSEDVFFEVSNRPDLMVRFANGSLEKEVFDRMLDSFFWDTKGVIKPPGAVTPPGQTPQTTETTPGAQGPAGQ